MANPAGNLANLRHFVKGQAPGPGHPIGLRNRVSTAFLKALGKDFDEHGVSAIEDCRKRDPSTYLKVLAGLLPREFVVQRPTEGLSDDELDRIIEELRARRAAFEHAIEHAPGDRVGVEADGIRARLEVEPGPPIDVSPLPQAD